MPTAVRRSALLAALAVLATSPHLALGFTQSSGSDSLGHLVPMGHEWITALAGLEVIDPAHHPLAGNDPRAHWPGAWRAQRATIPHGTVMATPHPVNDARYRSGFVEILSAIIGERWVDIGGINVAQSLKFDSYDCWSAVAQEPDAVQYDHFMRRSTDTGTAGGPQAIEGSRQRFIQHFVAAATAAPGDLEVWDGGGSTTLVTVDRRFFLFGRALHLLQDSFSPEHTVRIHEDGYHTVRNIKSYLCGPGAEQHTHAKALVFGYKGSGDAIWKPDSHAETGWASYTAANMTDIALVATEATKDAWASFLHVLQEPDANRRRALAVQQATVMVNDWMHSTPATVEHWYDDPHNRGPTFVKGTGDTGPGLTVPQCETTVLGFKPPETQVTHVRETITAQRGCLYNIVPASPAHTERDPHLHIPYNWKWRSVIKFETPPTSYVVPND